MNFGKKIFDFATEIFHINRSITGEGVRQTLTAISKHIPKLEIKSKRGFINCKNVSSLDNLHDIYFNFNGIKKLTDTVNKYFKNKKILIPTTSTHYERYYFISSNNLIRATLDTLISSSSLYKHCNHQFKKNFERKIFELKYACSLDDYVKNNIKNFLSRLSKSSKYIFSSVEKSNNYSI